jgi:small neutral amino acid transporter SnatA (MarC family)
MMRLFLFMLVILNPFAQVLYLGELMRAMETRPFAAVHLRASLLSYGVFALFALAGDFLLNDVFQVRLASLQIFGGLVILYIAYRYVAFGAGSNLLFRGDIKDLAPNISLPYMVGPGTIWISILLGRQFPWWEALAMIGGVLLINMVFVVFVQWLFGRLATHKETLLGKYFAILMRTNALFIGAISMEMILRGLQEAFPVLKGGS